MPSVFLTLAFSLDVQNASIVDHRMYHSLVKGIMVYLVLISLYWAFLQQGICHPQDEPFLKLQVYSMNHSAVNVGLLIILFLFGNMKR